MIYSSEDKAREAYWTRQRRIARHAACLRRAHRDWSYTRIQLEAESLVRREDAENSKVRQLLGLMGCGS